MVLTRNTSIAVEEYNVVVSNARINCLGVFVGKKIVCLDQDMNDSNLKSASSSVVVVDSEETAILLRRKHYSPNRRVLVFSTYLDQNKGLMVPIKLRVKGESFLRTITGKKSDGRWITLKDEVPGEYVTEFQHQSILEHLESYLDAYYTSEEYTLRTNALRLARIVNTIERIKKMQ